MSRFPAMCVACLAAIASLFPLACIDTSTTLGKYSPGFESGLGGAGGTGETPTLGTYIEAEEGALSGPFIVDSMASQEITFITASAPSESEDAPGEARALYQFSMEEPGDYSIWGRIHSPGALENRFWYRVNDSPWTLWRISTGDEWFWDDFHDDANFGEAMVFQLEGGTHRLELANAVTGSELDAIFILPLNAPPPEQEVICNPPHEVLLAGDCVRSCGSYLNVSCTPSVCEGREEVIAYDCAVCCLLDGP